MKTRIFFLIFLIMAVSLAESAKAQVEPGENKVLWVKDLELQTCNVCKFVPGDEYVMNNAGWFLQLRRASDGELIKEKNLGGPITDFDITPDGEHVIVCGVGFLKLFNTFSLEFEKDITLPEPFVLSNAEKISISKNGDKFAVSAIGDKISEKVFIFNLNTFQMLHYLEKEGGNYNFVKISPDGKYIAAAQYDYPYSISIYNANTYELYWEPLNKGDSGGRIEDMEFSHDSKEIVLANSFPGSTLRVYDVLNKKILAEEDANEKGSHSIVFSKDNSHLYMPKLSLYLYDIINKNIFEIITEKINARNSIDLNKNGDRLFAGTSVLAYYQVDPDFTDVVVENRVNEIVFPNPVTNNITLIYKVISPSEINYEISNQAGQVILKNNLGFYDAGEQNIEIITSTLVPGQYFLRIISNNNSTIYKFVKE